MAFRFEHHDSCNKVGSTFASQRLEGLQLGWALGLGVPLSSAHVGLAAHVAERLTCFLWTMAAEAWTAATTTTTVFTAVAAVTATATTTTATTAAAEDRAVAVEAFEGNRKRFQRRVLQVRNGRSPSKKLAYGC